MLRAGAGYALAALDDWRAVYVVAAHLANPVEVSGFWDTSASDGILNLTPCNERVRWTYIRCILRLLAAESQLFDERSGYVRRLELPPLLEALTGHRVPERALQTPGSVRREDFVRVVDAWRKWLREHEPRESKP